MKKYKNKEWLFEQYWTLDKSTSQIAKECSVIRQTINYWLRKFKIRIKKGKGKELYSNKEWLYKQYIILQKCPKEIEEEFKINQKTIMIWLKNLNIPIRNLSEAIKLSIKKGRHYSFEDGNVPWNKGLKSFIVGEKHPNWKGVDATYKVIHLYVQKKKEKPILCERCDEEKKLELSFDHSLGKCTRNIDDYLYLCHSCHMKRDWHEFKIMNNQFTIKKRKYK